MDEIKRRVAQYIRRYNNLPEWKIRQIVQFAKANRSASIYEEERSVIRTEEQNAAFIRGMLTHHELRPIDDLIQSDTFRSRNFQFNAHRGLYNNAFGIPQNSLAAILCAYVAGIRSIEFDVLESREGNGQPVNHVIHDLSTNRLSGSFADPPVYVERLPYSAVEATQIGVLNPLASAAIIESTGINRIMRTSDVLHFVHNIMPHATLYIDARNDSPVSVLQLLQQHPEYRDNVVLKIYPFTLDGGAYEMVAKYAARRRLSEVAAERELKTLNPQLLIAMGSAADQASEHAFIRRYSDFSWSAFQSRKFTLPFARNSSVSSNEFFGEAIFSEPDLREIESKTYGLFKWAMEFSAIGNVLVLQVTLIPSLRSLVDNQNEVDSVREFNAMPKPDRVNSAIIDNFVELYRQEIEGEFSTRIELGTQNSSYLRNEIKNAVFGLSDRYPDFSLAERDATDNVVQSTIKDFLYSMEGTVYVNDSYASRKMRSTEAVLSKINEMKAANIPVQYATTDLPTDLRAGMMGLLGTMNLPQDLNYRSSAVIKERMTPGPVASFVPPSWSTRMNGDAYMRGPATFDQDYANIRGMLNKRAGLVRSMDSISISRDHATILVNADALSRLSQREPVVVADLDVAIVNTASANLAREIVDLTSRIDSARADFARKYGVEGPSDPSFDYDS